MKYKKDIWKHTPVIAPAYGRLTSQYGYRFHPLLRVKRFHYGLDIAAPQWTEIYAAADGQVVSTRTSESFGKIITIDHGNGYLSRYAHLHTIGVKAGMSVNRNQQIGTMGSTGRSTGPHLHFEVIQGRVRRNPLGFLP